MDFFPHMSSTVPDEFQKLAFRINPPKVTVDNAIDKKTTLIKVDSANKNGSLLEVVQVLTDLNLIIKRAYISSDGGWFMDVFHVTDEYGNKVYEENDIPGESISEQIQQSLGPEGRYFERIARSRLVDAQPATGNTNIELLGRDRPGLLSEVFAILSDLQCNVVTAEVWTHSSRMASVLYITDEADGEPIDDPDRLANMKELLLKVLEGARGRHNANTPCVSLSSDHVQRRLHQIMYADRDFDNNDIDCPVNELRKPRIAIEDCFEKEYTVVSVTCPDRPKLLFDTVFTLTDMEYVIYHATIIAEGHVAHQEYFIRHVDGYPIDTEAERQRVIDCLEAAIKRRSFEGIRLELCIEDRVGLLSDVTRIFRENGLSVIRAEVATRDTQAINTFYVTDASGQEVKMETIEAIRNEIGRTVLTVKDDPYSTSPPQLTSGFSLRKLFRSGSEKLLYNLGRIKSCSPKIS